jgi:hypothetical protein
VVFLVIVWIVFSAILVTIICMNSSRLSRMDNLFDYSHTGGKEGDNDN